MTQLRPPRRVVGWLGGVVLALALAGCSPAGGDASPSPDGTTTRAASPSVPQVTPAVTEQDPRPVQSGPVDLLPDEQFPGEIAGFTFDPGMGAPVYDRGDGTVQDRILILEQAYSMSSADWIEGVDQGHQETRPGIWCYVSPGEGYDSCSVNGSTGRLWVTSVVIGDMTMEELAEWMEQFAEVVP